ncbi:hypothetical protein K525DRAFT_274982 [Schizophyllum commune Loenen D]|nr:hypothetical protein K525DRAFT_274982 [Schizophyllum commune Loenen D]
MPRAPRACPPSVSCAPQTPPRAPRVSGAHAWQLQTQIQAEQQAQARETELIFRSRWRAGSKATHFDGGGEDKGRVLVLFDERPAPSFASIAPDLSTLCEAPELPPLRGPVSFPRPLTPKSSLDSRASSRTLSRSASLYERGSLHERQGSWPEHKGSLSRHTRSRSSSIISKGLRSMNLMEMFDEAPSHAAMEDDIVPEVAGIE